MMTYFPAPYAYPASPGNFSISCPADTGKWSSTTIKAGDELSINLEIINGKHIAILEVNHMPRLFTVETGNSIGCDVKEIK